MCDDDLPWLPDPWPQPSGEMLQHEDGESAANQRPESNILTNQSPCLCEVSSPVQASQCRDFLKAEQFKEVWAVAGSDQSEAIIPAIDQSEAWSIL